MENKILAEVIEKLEKILGDEHQVDVTCQTKNNGVRKTGISISKKDENIGVIFYLDEILKRSDKDVDEIVIEISHDYLVAMSGSNLPANFAKKLLSFDSCKDMIFPRVVNKERNAELLLGVPYKEYLDLVVYYVCEMHTDDGVMSVKVDHSIFNSWEITYEVMHEVAIENMIKHDKFEFTSLFDTSLGEDITSKDTKYNGKLNMLNIQLTNGSNTARCILNDVVIDRLSKFFGGSFILLPACVDGLIAIPITDKLNLSDLSGIVNSVNNSDVIKDEEILSDHAYIYYPEKGWSW